MSKLQDVVTLGGTTLDGLAAVYTADVQPAPPPKSRKSRPPAPVNPAWAAALALADGDTRRISLEADGSYLVANKPRPRR